MLIAALILNLTVLVPLLTLLSRDAASMSVVYGPDTAARRILACLYGVIALASAGLVGLVIQDFPGAVVWTQGLLAIQILYKLATLPVVGPRNAVVRANLGIAAFHSMALLGS